MSLGIGGLAPKHAYKRIRFEVSSPSTNILFSSRNGNDFTVLGRYRFDWPIIVRRFLIHDFTIVIFRHLRTVPHFARDLPLVLRLLHAIAAKRMTQSVAFPGHVGQPNDLHNSLAGIFVEQRTVFDPIWSEPPRKILGHYDLAFPPCFR